jgi:hypothetical protein
VQEFKAFSIKMLKALKEDLARANQDYVKQLAKDTDWVFSFDPDAMSRE